MFKSRIDVTEAIIMARIKKGITWAEIATHIGKSKEWVTSACLGQMPFNKEDAQKLIKLLDLSPETLNWLCTIPNRGSLQGKNPEDPLLYRLYEMISVYGPALKELIHEEFGDGIMSAIDCHMSVNREKNPSGDRVDLRISGKFLPYKAF